MLSQKDKILNYIEFITTKYNYRPLPKREKEYAHNLYRTFLNGFHFKPYEAFPIKIKGELIATYYDKIVIGDYGAFLEINKDAIIKSKLIVPNNQKWRFDEDFIFEKNLNIKYYHYEFNGIKIYHQIDRVRYADYQPDMFYVSPLLVQKCVQNNE